MDKSKMDKLKSMTRKEVCDFIIENFELFKVCDSCDAILTYKCHICPVCASYRFDETEKRIKKQAKIFKNKPRKKYLYSDFL